MQLTKAQIQEIAEGLDMGLICYVHKETKEVKLVVDVNQGYDTDGWEEMLEEIDENDHLYERIEPMWSNDSFEVMEDFANQVSNRSLKIQLLSALDRKKPFRNFNEIIHNSGDYRNEWFEYKLARYMA